MLPTDLLKHEQNTRQHFSAEVDPRVLAYLTVLDEYRLGCEAQGKYTEAGIALQQVGLIRTEEEERCAIALAASQASTRAELARSHDIQYASFQETWETFLQRYDDAGQKYLSEVHARQATALKAFQDQCAEEVIRKPFKGTRELLNWRERADGLARQRKYADASRVRNVADELERRERAAFNASRLQSFGLREAAFLKDQQAEVDALTAKIALRRAEHLSCMKGDVDKLLQRNANALAMLQGKQVGEAQKAVVAVRITLATTRAHRQFGMAGSSGVSAGVIASAAESRGGQMMLSGATEDLTTTTRRLALTDAPGEPQLSRGPMGSTYRKPQPPPRYDFGAPLKRG